MPTFEWILVVVIELNDDRKTIAKFIKRCAWYRPDDARRALSPRAAGDHGLGGIMKIT